ncbi:MAG: hypothetical protein O2815_03150 [Actinomycetota bacterium]|nr:hypothetical protein [Actinomycetota bacterium]
MTFEVNDEATVVADVEANGSEQVDEILVLDEAPDPQATLPVWEPTGNAAVDAALEELHAVAQSDLGEHAEIYERVQQSLRATLDGLAADDDPA